MQYIRFDIIIRFLFPIESDYYILYQQFQVMTKLCTQISDRLVQYLRQKWMFTSDC